jgi:hypothetical protein
LSKGPKYREPVKIDWMEARFFLLRTHWSCLLIIYLRRKGYRHFIFRTGNILY